MGAMSYKAPRKRAITVRVAEAQLKRVMRARGIATQSELINTLLAEEAEKIVAVRALEATAGTAGPKDFDDRLL
jgi:hypothetical protein